MNPKVKELLKSVHICQSYRKNKSGTFFMAHGVYIPCPDKRLNNILSHKLASAFPDPLREFLCMRKKIIGIKLVFNGL